jgi:hypothetical protein
MFKTAQENFSLSGIFAIMESKQRVQILEGKNEHLTVVSVGNASPFEQNSKTRPFLLKNVYRPPIVRIYIIHSLSESKDLYWPFF